MTRGRFDQMSRRTQVLVCLVLAGLLTVAGWRTFVRPVEAGLAGDRARLAALENRIAVARGLAARLPIVAREVAGLEARLRDRQGAEAVSLATLHRIAGATGLRITRFEPEPPVRRVEATEQVFALGLEGTYHALGAFFDRLAVTNGLLVVEDLDIHAGAPVAGRNDSTLEATCHITAVVLDTRKDMSAGVATPTGIEAFSSTYEAGHRRDPFLDRMPSMTPPELGPTPRIRGLAGLAAADVVVRGIARKGGTRLAVLEGPDGRSYVGHVGARLHDASLIHIASDAVLLSRDDRDGEGGDTVRKPLRGEVERP